MAEQTGYKSIASREPAARPQTANPVRPPPRAPAPPPAPEVPAVLPSSIQEGEALSYVQMAIGLDLLELFAARVHEVRLAWRVLLPDAGATVIPRKIVAPPENLASACAAWGRWILAFHGGRGTVESLNEQIDAINVLLGDKNMEQIERVEIATIADQLREMRERSGGDANAYGALRADLDSLATSIIASGKDQDRAYAALRTEIEEGHVSRRANAEALTEAIEASAKICGREIEALRADNAALRADLASLALQATGSARA